MESLYDVQQLFRKFGVFIHVDAHIYDIELVAIELRNLYGSRLIDHDTYTTAWHILEREHRAEENRKKGNS